MSIGEKIKAYRKSQGITQAKLADDLNLSREVISMYENDKRQPSFNILMKFADISGMTLDEICRTDEYKA